MIITIQPDGDAWALTAVDASGTRTHLAYDRAPRQIEQIVGSILRGSHSGEATIAEATARRAEALDDHRTRQSADLTTTPGRTA